MMHTFQNIGKYMLEFIIQFQNHLATEGSNVNNIVALFLALIAIMLTGYLVESENK